MTWPQYFDGKGWANDISSRYGINAIPTAWLVDKKGLVRTTQARGADLADAGQGAAGGVVSETASRPPSPPASFLTGEQQEK